MNALSRTLYDLIPLESKPIAKHDGFEDIESPLQKWAVRCYYKIVQRGVPNSRPNMGPDADGVPTRVRIVQCSLVQRVTQEELERSLSDFTGDELEEFAETIEQILDRREA